MMPTAAAAAASLFARIAHALSVQTSEQTTRAYLLLAQKQLQPSNRLTIAAAGARLLLANNLQPLVVVVVLIENPFIMIRERDERTTSSSNEYKKLSAPNKSSLAELVITHKASNFCQQFDARTTSDCITSAQLHAQRAIYLFIPSFYSYSFFFSHTNNKSNTRKLQ